MRSPTDHSAPGSSCLALKARITWVSAAAALVLLFAPLVWTQKAAAPSPLAAARAQAGKGDLDAAEKSVWTVLTADPNNLEALNLLGTIRAEQQRYAEAEALFRRVLQANPKLAAASKNLAMALLAQDKVDDALAQFCDASKLAPQDYQLKLQFARLLASRNRYSEALAALNSIPAVKYPATAVPDKAACLIALGRKPEAAALTPGVKQSPNAAVDLAEVFLAGGMPDDALKALPAAAPKDALARYYYLKGSALQAKGQTSTAQSNFKQALQADPKFTDVLVAMAASDAEAGKHGDAADLLQRAHEANPDSLPVLRHLVEESMRAGQFGRALPMALQLQAQSPDNPDDQYMVAAVLLQVRKYMEAEALFEKYTAQRPQDPRGFLGLGVAYLNRQNYDGARRAFQKALDIDPALSEARYQLGVVTGKEGNNRQAIEIFEQVLARDPRHEESLVAVGALYFQEGELEKARQALERATQADPKGPDAEYQLSLVLNRMGNTAEARVHMQRFRDLKAAKDKLEEQQRAAPPSAGNPPN
jgi:superkiller protein 3